MTKKLVFITHEASRTGAPILLLRLIAEVKKSGVFDLSIIVLSKGVMDDAFSALAPTYFNDRSFPHYGYAGWVLARTPFYKLTEEYTYRKKITSAIAEADIIFANTIACIPFLERFNLSGKRVYFYIHELLFASRLLLTDQQMRKINEISSKIFVPAAFVRNFLVQSYGFSEEKLKVLKYIIPFDARSRSTKKSGHAFTAGVCGSLDLRKGSDLFGFIVREMILTRKVTDIKFVWVGVRGDNLEKLLTLESDLYHLGLQSYVELISATDNVQSYIEQFDVFLLPSREDPYPLVVAEAASMGIPTVYFEGAGGIGELLEDGGVGVPYLDVAAFVDALIRLKNDPAYLKALGENARRNFLKEKERFNSEQFLVEIES